MTFVTLNQVLQPAWKNHYAVGQFNINGNHWIEAILLAAQAEQAPVIVAASDRMVDFLGGFRLVAETVAYFQEYLQVTVPVVLHLDHGRSVERCLEAIDAGFSSVMIDGSSYPIAQNVKMVKKVVDYGHKRGVSVEAEVGSVGGNEDGLISGVCYASLEDCLRLVEQTKVDALAAALGSVHGRYVGAPVLGFAEMEAIAKACAVPLVLHGASGLSASDLQKAINYGHAKININTEINQTWFSAIARQWRLTPDTHEPQTVLEPAKQAMVKTVQDKIRLFGSNQQALNTIINESRII